MHIKNAFTIVELLVSMTIIAILLGIAIPAYGDYIVKARVIELLSVADAYKLRLAEDLFTANFDQNIYNLDSDLVDYVAVANIDGTPTKHVIQVVAKMKGAEGAGIGISQPNTADNGLAIQLQGVATGEVITWSCHVAADYNRYVPKICQNNNIEKINLG